MHDTRLHCSRPTMILLCAALASLCAITAGASDRRGSDDAQRGSFFATFDTRSRQSGPKAVHKRFGARAGRRIRDYHIEDETFKVIVPESYDPKTPFGVFVFITPDDDNRTMGDAWAEVMEEHKLIFVGAVDSGNRREAWQRVGLALDALDNIRTRYTIDGRRIYLSGVSGGGRVASRMGLLYADVFTGAIYMCGCDYFRNVPVPDDRDKAWRARFKRPPNRLLHQARADNRYVFLTGDTDPNRRETLGVFNAYERDNFTHVEYLQVPGMGHEYPPADWVEKGIEALDAPLSDQEGSTPKRPATR